MADLRRSFDKAADEAKDRLRPLRDRLTDKVPAAAPLLTRKPAMRPLERQRKFWTESSEALAPGPYASASVQAIISSLEDNYDRGEPVLEIGSGLGATLAALVDAGFSNVTGVEINPLAVQMMRKKYPQLRDVDVLVGPAETVLAGMADDSYPLVVAVRTLQHTHPDSAHLFGTIARLARTVVTIDEPAVLGRHRYPWDFAQEFARFGFEVREHKRLMAGRRATQDTVLVLRRAADARG
ncbi:class I SAM-dependent methyltransferase [Luteipulveratus mongoliensis]|uniref:class I SAM-dependent methyltransferase n=1 Tax=Luteipulveratus mongoliensis TaxID=571913 RepID=UPI000696E2CC|nr:class I SAM-dependent methyltransferase [Luteipulveratus mongoliensis]